MNKQRRKTLTRLSSEAAVLIAKLEDIKSELETCRDEEQEYYDAMPESFQNGDKGSAATTAIEAMESALGMLDDLDEVTSKIDEAIAE